ncbi:hypothetical protein ACP70R_022748 [Stipagrostis hirtigluma subsp. patula]
MPTKTYLDGSQVHEEPADEPLRDENSDNSSQHPSSEVQPLLDEQIRNAGNEIKQGEDAMDQLAPMECHGVVKSNELDGSKTSPRCSLSPESDDDSGVVGDELGQASPMLMFSAGSDDLDGHVFDDKWDVVDLVTPTPVGRLWRID